MKHSLLLIIILLNCGHIPNWGFHAHKLINEFAIYTLPMDLIPFYKNNLHYIREMAVNADKRVYIDTAESKRHYLDLDKVELPQDSLIIPWYKLEKKQNLMRKWSFGIIPWQIDITYRKLVKAFYNHDSEKIIKHSADIGHYLADAHVPLHSSSNYNGQFTNQMGIHALWETRIPEKYIPTYNLFVGKAAYIPDVLAFAWKTINKSHNLLDSVFKMEMQTRQDIPAIQHKTYIVRGNQTLHNYSETYVDHYHNLLDGMVENRLRMSIQAIGSIWLSAWIDAGQPDLTKSKPISVLQDTIPYKGKTSLGREEWHE